MLQPTEARWWIVVASVGVCVLRPAFLLGEESRSVEQYVELHCAALEAANPIDVRVDVISRNKSGDGGELPAASVHWLRDGLRELHVARTTAFSQDGKAPVESEEPHFSEIGLTASETRRMKGWDRDNPFPTPLRPGGAHASQYARVAGWIGPRDPKMPYPNAPFWLLLTVDQYFSLKELVECKGVTCRIIEEHPDRVQLEFRRSDGELEHSFPEKLHCWLDGDANWLISRIDVFEDDSEEIITRKVVTFDEPVPGIWFPTRLENTSTHQDTMLEIRTADLRVNEPIPAEELVLKFPEGARVHELAKGLTHIWGDGKPEHTFSDEDARYRWEMETAGARPADESPATGSTGGFRGWLVVSNIVILVIIGILLYLRRHTNTTG